MTKQTRITIETDSLLILQGRSSRRAWCSRCAAEVEMIALEETGVVSNLEQPELDEWLNSGELHRWQAADGSSLMCLNSLLARVQKTNNARGSRGYETDKGDDMNSKWKLTSLSLGLVASLATMVAPAAEAPESEASRNIPSPTLACWEKATNATANDMNSIGWVAGQSNLVPNGPQHSFLWYGSGPLVDIGTLGGPNSGAGGPNLYGEAAVESELAVKDPNNEDFCAFGTHLECRGAIWRYGKLDALPRLPGGHNSNAFGVNNLGQVIGWSENGVRDSTCSKGTPSQVFRYEAVKWDVGWQDP